MDNMNKILIFVLIFFAFSFHQPATEMLIRQPDFVKKTGKDNVSAEVLEVIKAWNSEFEKNNPAAYFEHIHDDLTLFVPSSPYRCTGKRDDREEFEWSLKQGNSRVHFFQEIDPQVQVYGNAAVVTYYNRGIYGPTGKEAVSYLKETDVLVKENGKWRIVHIHVSK
jgi:ketosteroid isomerase-like protein